MIEFVTHFCPEIIRLSRVLPALDRSFEHVLMNLSIKNVPDDIARSLRERAARNHRSLQKELLLIVESAVREEEPVTIDVPAGVYTSPSAP